MKKMLFAALSLLYSCAALAQTSTTSDQLLPKAELAQQPHTELKLREQKDYPEAASPRNHGQAVRTVARETALEGAEKGALVSSVASRGRSRTLRTARCPRPGRVHGLRAASNERMGGRQGNNGHRAFTKRK
ncbi:hypothetical protein [Hymenobacter metallicola]|uniref:DUF4148 domain-containing protein n=1 Tax=Hymenobacter metallicola TaxID=2563114 RepID=A0A4Z0QJE9_9BACT|nr:hypothetical protein [Hymenobacter metallicola]TGE29413.1 hypothetical protein E5K02_08160 [Hymenobacter metallicola]